MSGKLHVLFAHKWLNLAYIHFLNSEINVANKRNQHKMIITII